MMARMDFAAADFLTHRCKKKSPHQRERTLLKSDA